MNVANIGRISADRLSALLLSPTSKGNIAIIDVRDDDHIGGHIRGSTHVPSASLDYRMAEIVRTMADKDMVVFHCALSQQRGPAAALRYARERQAKMAQEIGSKDSRKKEHSDITKQKIYVLDRGFTGWQQKYGKDARLTDAYVEDIWVNE